VKTATQAEEVLIIRVYEVEELLVKQLASCAQLGAQILEGLMAVMERAEVGGGREVGGEEVGALEGRWVGEVVFV
jgi:hypothetical protein